MSAFIEKADGYYTLTQAGFWVAVAIAVIAMVLVPIFVGKGRKSAVAAGTDEVAGGENVTKNGKSATGKYSVRKLVFSAVAIALGFALSYVKIFRMPWGGSVTLCSMLFVTLVGNWYGVGAGFSAAFAYGLLQFVQGGGGYMLSPLQVAMDYLLAFTMLGASGFFANKKNGLIKGFLVACLLRGLCHSIGGYLYWMDYMPDNFPKELAAVYPILYNYAYIVAEAIITCVVISLPQVKNGLATVKKMALS